jgi:uncharacterized iron-regulated membrane protein
MKSITIKKLYKLHTWVGIITGILLFVIAFTGAVAVFARPELKIWANEEIRSPVKTTPLQIQQVIEKYAQEVGPEYQEEVHVQLAGARSSSTLRVIYEGHFEQEDGSERHEGIVYEFDPNTLEKLKSTDMETYFSEFEYDMASFIASFHADLHLGRPVGLILTGLLGLTLMVSIVTGILVHRKKLPQLFTFRPQKSFSLLLNDGHKVMGVWGVAFHSILAFTGAFLGLATVILVPAAAYVSFGGDQEKLIETFTATKAPIISHISQPTKLADVLEVSAKEKPELTITNLTVMGYGDKNALVYAFGSGDENLGGQTLVFEGATATLLKVQSNFGRLEGVTGKILDAMFPLHFGNFAGVFVKTIWAWLGLAMALLPISGIMLWIERGLSAQNPAHSITTYKTMSRLLVGSCGGIVLAVGVLFPAQLLLNAYAASTNHTSEIFTTFFATWGIATLIGLILPSRKGLLVLGSAIAICLVSVMPLDALLTGSHPFNVFDTGHVVSISVDITLFVLGALLITFLRKQFNTSAANSRAAPSPSAVGN